MTMASLTPRTSAGGMGGPGPAPGGRGRMAVSKPSGSSQHAPMKRTTYH
jgi:hypothetical protein